MCARPKPVRGGRARRQTTAAGARSRWSSHSLSGLVSVTVFFVVFYVCLWRGVDVKLIYHVGGEIPDFPVFYWGWDFARELLPYPGGGGEYVASFLMQSLYHSWLGALVLTGQAWVLFCAAKAYAHAVGLGWPGLAASAAPLLLLWLYASYCHYAPAVTSLAMVSLSLWLVVGLGAARAWLRLGVVLVLSALLYPVAAGALPVFALAAALLEWRRGGRGWPLLLLVAGAAVPWAEGGLLFGLASSESWQSLQPIAPEHHTGLEAGLTPLYLLFLLLPGLGLAGLARRISVPCISRIVRQASSSNRLLGSLLSGTARMGRSPLAQAAGTAIAVTGVFYTAQDRQLHSVLAVDYFACHQMWPQALAVAPDCLRNPFVAATAAQAACHTHQLVQRLPRLRNPNDLLLLDRKELGHWKQVQLYLDLGFVNQALHHLAEAVEFWGERPMLLERLAVVNLAIGNIPTARIYLEALARVPFHGSWARAYLGRLAADPSLATDAEVMRLRGLMVLQDTAAQLGVEAQLRLLLAANGRNRMAFEYLMTWYLLSKDLDGFVRALPYRRNFDGLEFSPLWQEALALWRRGQGQNAAVQAALPGPEMQQRVDQLLRVFQECRGNEAAARARLQDDYGESYCYYYLLQR